MVDQCGYYTRRELSNTNHSVPSFSSTLLDAIYRSIDQGEHEDIPMYGETMRKKQQHSSATFRTEEEIANFQRACMIEKLMEKKVREKTATRRTYTAAEPVVKSSFCEYSGGGGGAESFWPKPIRVCDSGGLMNKEVKSVSKNQDGFTKTKSRPALKIYPDLKKMKQPISPGARLTGFLNSLFASAAGNTKKPKMNIKPSGPDSRISKSANASTTCSSASSFSRSCLSKTPPPARGKPAGGEPKRSVRFSPVEMDGTRRKQNSEAINQEILMVHANVIESNRRVEKAVARDFLIRNSDGEFDDDDAASNASSDLFELDNLSGIGMERYREELPVYETTHLHTNRAIASGLIM